MALNNIVSRLSLLVVIAAYTFAAPPSGRNEETNFLEVLKRSTINSTNYILNASNCTEKVELYCKVTALHHSSKKVNESMVSLVDDFYNYHDH